ncbi:MAG TPA: glycosyltransferase family 2 protein [Anaerolineales bacterium]|nr:glycosyltransferase family 2 protein [Anaerolineales bacterium]
MSSPRVLVVIPLYNALAYIRQAIQSILDQSYSDFVLLVVNDGSTDGSGEVARSFNDARVIVLDQPNRGVGAVMNTAIAFACERAIPYIACMAADDISMPNRLEVQLHLLETHKDVAACGSNCYYVDAHTEEVIGTSTVPLSSLWIKWEIFHGLRGLVEGASTFRTEALCEVGGYRPQFVQAEDTDIFLRLAEKFALMNAPQYLYKIRFHTESLSVKNYHKNVLYHFYALDCSRRRRRGQPEMDLSEFMHSLTFGQRWAIWREVRFLELWRQYLTRRNGLYLLAALCLSPKRLVSRILRRVDQFSRSFLEPGR